MYYGPFPRVKTVAHTVRELGQALGLRDCSDPTPVFFDDQLKIFEGDRIPNCIRADLCSCLAPCCGRPAASQYQAAVDLARQFLEGKKAHLALDDWLEAKGPRRYPPGCRSIVRAVDSSIRLRE
jgi:excinuclease ABC subunit C